MHFQGSIGEDIVVESFFHAFNTAKHIITHEEPVAI
jgi:hypothetical protein